ncbi:MAG TPA: hypothetical protein VFS20_25735 [Longimicrobium sp.]|nr:hypothetical protein [Longimicrobium sp.]
MSAPSAAPSVRALRFSAGRDAGLAWSLQVEWLVRAAAGGGLHLVVDPPLATPLADPLVLDHRALPDPPGVDANHRAPLRLLPIGPEGELRLPMRYALAFPPGTRQVTVIGRFGHGAASPDEAAELAASRLRAAAWQQTVDAEPFVLRLEEGP